MTAHVCSTECPCGHWKPRRSAATAGKRGRITLDVIDGNIDGPTYDPDYQEKEYDDDGD